MTIKEITALRKAGKIEEALQAAENEFSLNANNFTAATLFWCLNDISKQNTSQDAIEVLFERMKSLYENYCPGDERMPNSLNAIEKRIDTLSKELSEATKIAKNGAITDDLIQKCMTHLNTGDLSTNLYGDLGWLIYYNLKATPTNDVDKRKQLLRDYLKLGLPRPELLHSLILREAVKVEKNTPLKFRIRDFMNLWGWGNFRPEDWDQFQSDNGNTRNSLIEKLISVYVKELKTDKVISPNEFHTLVDIALVKYPNNQYMPLYKANVLISLGKNGEALEYYKELIMKTPSKCYLWEQAAEIVDDVEMRIGLLCKAISVEKDESFVGGCRLNLAKALIEYGLLPNAKCELDKYYNFYTSQGWGLKQDFKEVVHLIPQGTIAEDNTSLYNEFIPKAETFIYSAIPSQFAIKIEDRQIDDKKRPGRKFIQWTLMTKNGTIRLKKPNNFGLDSRMKNGTPFDIKINEDKIVWIKQSEENPLGHDWIKTHSGIVRLRADRNGKKYAIIDGTYVGEKHLMNITDGQNVKLVAVRQEDGRWSAISLAKL